MFKKEAVFSISSTSKNIFSRNIEMNNFQLFGSKNKEIPTIRIIKFIARTVSPTNIENLFL